ncbi:membrane efflux protein (fosmidomycin resistance) [Leifsonia xyli subsp. cynodontis DSM 46306]|uniref:Major facilitator superfamily (MFS) profile domain-containing protein n=1 Tax=Leifsonia xyli subsp. cynodontis DSM 46306 TaxID=1389489 RepID=U3P817_LEIXC|nr:membrane efflux protein (fosmidomycin resistance) [Leifsonia xyli subsp. cynodontis DSM 46306]
MTGSRRIGRDVWALSFATFVNRATGFLGLFAAIFFSETGMTAGTVVIALLIVGIAGVGGSLLGGQLADRFGRLAILLGSTLINVALFAALAVIDYSMTWWVVGISAASVLVSQAFVGPASALIAASADGPDRVTRFAFYRIFINVGSIVAPAIVGLIGREHFDLLFWFSAAGSRLVPVVLLGGLGRRKADRAQPETRDEAAKPATEAAVPKPNAIPRLALPFVYVAMALAMVVYAQHQSAVPLRLDTEPNGVQLYSLLLIINPVIVIAIEYPLSHVTKRMPAHAALAIGVVVMGVGVTVTGSFANVTAVAVISWVLFSVGECVFAPMSNSYVAELSSAAAQSRAQGRLAAFQSVGAALGPGIGSWMAARPRGRRLDGLPHSDARVRRPHSRRMHCGVAHRQEAPCPCFSLIPSARAFTITASCAPPVSNITSSGPAAPSTAGSPKGALFRTSRSMSPRTTSWQRSCAFCRDRDVETVITGAESGVPLAEAVKIELGLASTAFEDGGRRFWDKPALYAAVRRAGLRAPRQIGVLTTEEVRAGAHRSLLAEAAFPLVVKNPMSGRAASACGSRTTAGRASTPSKRSRPLPDSSAACRRRRSFKSSSAVANTWWTRSRTRASIAFWRSAPTTSTPPRPERWSTTVCAGWSGVPQRRPCSPRTPSKSSRLSITGKAPSTWRSSSMRKVRA